MCWNHSWLLWRTRFNYLSNKIHKRKINRFNIQHWEINKTDLFSAWRSTPTVGGAETVELTTGPKTAASFNNNSSDTFICLHYLQFQYISQNFLSYNHSLISFRLICNMVINDYRSVLLASKSKSTGSKSEKRSNVRESIFSISTLTTSAWTWKDGQFLDDIM